MIGGPCVFAGVCARGANRVSIRAIIRCRSARSTYHPAAPASFAEWFCFIDWESDQRWCDTHMRACKCEISVSGPILHHSIARVPSRISSHVRHTHSQLFILGGQQELERSEQKHFGCGTQKKNVKMHVTGLF